MPTSADIKTDVPVTGNPTTLSVRENFAEIKGAVAATETSISTKAERAGDLGGTAASSTVIRLQGRAMANTAPTTNQALVYNGTQWAPGNVAQLQGRAVSAAAPAAAGQVLTWSGSDWAPQTAGAGLPAGMVFRPMTSDMHTWIPPGTEGYFAGLITNAPVISNSPGLFLMGPLWWQVTGFSNSTGYISLRAEAVYNGGYPGLLGETGGPIVFVKRRYGTVASGYWTAWQREGRYVWYVHSNRVFNYTITSSPQMLPDFNVAYRPFIRRHIYRSDDHTLHSSMTTGLGGSQPIYMGGWLGNIHEPDGDSPGEFWGATLVVDQGVPPVGNIRTYATDGVGTLEHIWNHTSNELIYWWRPSGSTSFALRVTVMALIEVP